jgi:hypothetical protein
LDHSRTSGKTNSGAARSPRIGAAPEPEEEPVRI